MAPRGLDPRLVDLLASPRTGKPLKLVGDSLLSDEGECFPIVDGIRVLLLPEAVPSGNGAAEDTLQKIRGNQPLGEVSGPDWSGSGVHPLVQRFIAASGGNLYKRSVGKLLDYPIPEFPMNALSGEVVIDIGCHWGRWALAAARKGFMAVGVDPSLEAVRAASSVAAQLKLDAVFCCADARFLPFLDQKVDRAFSFSVFQHFSRSDVQIALREIKRTLSSNGRSMIQMPNSKSILGIYHLIKRRFAEGTGFEVRYWTRDELMTCFSAGIGPTNVQVDSFFSINVQPLSSGHLPPPARKILRLSQVMVKLSRRIPMLQGFADSYWVISTKGG